MPTVLITGCSSGFGLDAARYFLERDWDVIATMRTPHADLLPTSDKLRVLALDVTDADSISRAMAEAGPIDVLVNNAGLGMMQVVEASPMEAARIVFETNTLGLMAMCRAVVPQFRERKAGVIVNVSSSTTHYPLPMLAIYTASKAAVNAYSASLALELAAFDVRVRLVIPGLAPETAFGSNAREHFASETPPAYVDFAANFFSRMSQVKDLTTSQDVAKAIWYAATDPASPFRLPAGADSVKAEAALYPG